MNTKVAPYADAIRRAEEARLLRFPCWQTSIRECTCADASALSSQHVHDHCSINSNDIYAAVYPTSIPSVESSRRAERVANSEYGKDETPLEATSPSFVNDHATISQRRNVNQPYMHTQIDNNIRRSGSPKSPPSHQTHAEQCQYEKEGDAEHGVPTPHSGSSRSQDTAIGVDIDAATALDMQASIQTPHDMRNANHSSASSRRGRRAPTSTLLDVSTLRPHTPSIARVEYTPGGTRTRSRCYRRPATAQCLASYTKDACVSEMLGDSHTKEHCTKSIVRCSSRRECSPYEATRGLAGDRAAILDSRNNAATGDRNRHFQTSADTNAVAIQSEAVGFFLATRSEGAFCSTLTKGEKHACAVQGTLTSARVLGPPAPKSTRYVHAHVSFHRPHSAMRNLQRKPDVYENEIVLGLQTDISANTARAGATENLHAKDHSAGHQLANPPRESRSKGPARRTPWSYSSLEARKPSSVVLLDRQSIKYTNRCQQSAQASPRVRTDARELAGLVDSVRSNRLKWEQRPPRPHTALGLERKKSSYKEEIDRNTSCTIPINRDKESEKQREPIDKISAPVPTQTHSVRKRNSRSTAELPTRLRQPLLASDAGNVSVFVAPDRLARYCDRSTKCWNSCTGKGRLHSPSLPLEGTSLPSDTAARKRASRSAPRRRLTRMQSSHTNAKSSATRTATTKRKMCRNNTSLSGVQNACGVAQDPLDPW